MKLPLALPLLALTSAQDRTGCGLPAAPCSLNGVCDTALGQCACDPGWHGETCATLKLIPAARKSGFHMFGAASGAPNAATSSWGGVVERQDDGSWGMVSSELIQHCGINSWCTNSRVVYASAAANQPHGPYTHNRTLFGPFAHEPSLARAPNGSWALYFGQYRADCAVGGEHYHPPCACASEQGTPKNCSSEIPESECPHVTWLSTAPALRGPWSAPREVPLLDCNKTFCQHDMVLAGKILPNGSFVGIAKVHSKYGSEAHRVTANDWADADGYKQSPNDESGNLFPPATSVDGGRVEDPSEPWQNERGEWHTVCDMCYLPLC